MIWNGRNKKNPQQVETRLWLSKVKGRNIKIKGGSKVNKLR